MKKYIITMITTILFVAAVFVVAENGEVHLFGTVHKAGEVRNALRNMPCDLEGKLVTQLDKDHYLFHDASGNVVVHIHNNMPAAVAMATGEEVHLDGGVLVARGVPHEVGVRKLQVAR